jgi:putative peptide zinc metalloprotease protein
MTAVAEADVPVGLRARRDLVVCPQVFQGQRFWCVKDPVQLAYFHLREEEYAILQALEDRVSLSRILETFRSKFPGVAADSKQIQAFLAGLYRHGLVTAEMPGQGEKLWDRRTRARRRAWLGAVPSVLAIRLRGIDPTRLLRALYDHVWWLFSPVALAISAALIVAAGVVALTRSDEVLMSLPDASAFFTAQNMVLFLAAMGTIKVAHEIGHALTCLRFGGECHEMGIMFLVFAPCLYCDVSDSWLFASKWRRIAVASAGICVELLLASLATFAWVLSEPGLFHAFCVNVMLICSVNTLLFNGNPLLRYDGYFVLSDLIEVPNLAAEARSALSRLLLGRDEADPPVDARELVLLAYGVAATIYRAFVTFAIVWLCVKMLTSLGLQPFGYLLAALCLVGFVAGPATSLAGAALAPRPRRLRALLTLVLTVGAVVFAGLIPLPHRIEAPAILRPRDATQVFVPVGGTLVESVAAGSEVQREQTIARLEDAALAREIVQLESRLAELTTQVEVLESRRLSDPALAAQIPSTTQAARAALLQLERRREDLADLTIRAPRPGIVLPAPVRVPSESEDELPFWSGTPTESSNLGSYLEAGTLFCLIGDPNSVEAVVIVEEGSVAFLQPGQPVRLQFDQSAGGTLKGVVEEIAIDALRTAPPELSKASLLPVRRTDDGVLRPTETVYEVRVRLKGVDGTKLRIRGTGRAKIETDSERLFDRAYRFLRRTFRFDL